MQTILLVEDDLRLREIYYQRLVAEGYNVMQASDGAEALSLLSAQIPDLVIADVMMPNVSGFTMLQTLKSNPATANVRVVMMTALSQPQDKVHGEQLGANRYLVKSQVALEDLVNTAREVISEEPALINPSMISAPVEQVASAPPVGQNIAQPQPEQAPGQYADNQNPPIVQPPAQEHQQQPPVADVTSPVEAHNDLVQAPPQGSPPQNT